MLESRPASTPAVESNQRAPRWQTWLILACVVLALAIVDEVRTSRLQSTVLARYAAQLTYDIGARPELLGSYSPAAVRTISSLATPACPNSRIGS